MMCKIMRRANQQHIVLYKITRTNPPLRRPPLQELKDRREQVDHAAVSQQGHARQELVELEPLPLHGLML